MDTIITAPLVKNLFKTAGRFTIRVEINGEQTDLIVAKHKPQNTDRPVKFDYDLYLQDQPDMFVGLANKLRLMKYLEVFVIGDDERKIVGLP